MLDTLKFFMVGLIVLSSCMSHEVEGEVEVSDPTVTVEVEIKFLLEEALEIIDPFASVGATLDPLLPDEEIIYCTPTNQCVTAGDFRRAAWFMLENVRTP